MRVQHRPIAPGHCESGGTTEVTARAVVRIAHQQATFQRLFKRERLAAGTRDARSKVALRRAVCVRTVRADRGRCAVSSLRAGTPSRRHCNQYGDVIVEMPSLDTN